MCLWTRHFILVHVPFEDSLVGYFIASWFLSSQVIQQIYDPFKALNLFFCPSRNASNWSIRPVLLSSRNTSNWSIWPVLLSFQEHIIEPVRTALKYYSEMAKALEEEKKRSQDRRDSLTNGNNSSSKKAIETNSVSSSSSSLSQNGKRLAGVKTGQASNNPHGGLVKDKKLTVKPTTSTGAKSTAKTKWRWCFHCGGKNSWDMLLQQSTHHVTETCYCNLLPQRCTRYLTLGANRDRTLSIHSLIFCCHNANVISPVCSTWLILPSSPGIVRVWRMPCSGLGSNDTVIPQCCLEIQFSCYTTKAFKFQTTCRWIESFYKFIFLMLKWLCGYVSVLLCGCMCVFV